MKAKVTIIGGFVTALWLCVVFTEVLAQRGGPPSGPPTVIIYEVKATEFVDRIEALGTLQANESVTLTSTVTETLSAVNFQDGQRVEAGFMLAEMTSLEEKALLDEAQAVLDEAKMQFERLQPLIARSAVPKSTVDERRREYETAQARHRALLSRIQDRVIVAPFPGVVGLRNISVGALVTPGEVIATVDDDSVMKLDFSVPSTFLSVLRPGLEVVAVARGLDGQVYKGQVVSIDSRIDPTTRSIAVRALLNNEERLLRPGLLMTVELLKNQRESLYVPEEALIVLDRQASVFILGGETGVAVSRVGVEIGSRVPGKAEILSGLKAGDRVVVHGHMALRDGVEVKVLGALGPEESIRDILARASSKKG